MTTASVTPDIRLLHDTANNEFKARYGKYLRWALVIAVIYAFGTSSWSVSSQALWQHGPSQLFLTFFLFCLVRGMKEERFLVYAGFAMSSAIVMRPTDVLIALPVAACVLYTRPRSTLRIGLFALPPMAGLLLYYARSGLADEGLWNTTTPIWAFFTQVPLVDGLAGLLAVPLVHAVLALADEVREFLQIRHLVG